MDEKKLLNFLVKKMGLPVEMAKKCLEDAKRTSLVAIAGFWS